MNISGPDCLLLLLQSAVGAFFMHHSEEAGKN